MEFLSIFAVLAQRRVLVALGVPLALLIAAMAAGLLPFGPGSTSGAATGLAQTRVMVDHKKAVVADTAEISDTVGTQAALLADVISGDGPRAAIARRAGIPAADLGLKRMQLAQFFALGQLSERAAKVSADVQRPYVVNVWAATPLPVLTIDVTAPSAPQAARIAEATRATLGELVRARAPSERRSIVVKPLGTVRAVPIPGSTPSKIVAVAAAIAFLVFWLCAVVVLHGLLRVWRNATAERGAAAASSY
jgi:hypothetical protein